MLRRNVWCAWALGAIILSVALVGFQNYVDKNDCGMSWSYPVFVSLDFKPHDYKSNSKYNVYLYREGGVSSSYEREEDIEFLGGTPVLFIPGNAGSYYQGRSIASLAANWPEFDWFLVDFDEELSGFSGKILMDESMFVNDAIKFVLDLYQKKKDYDPGFVVPKSVILVAHSMGGVVASAVFTLPNYNSGSVNTLVTLSSPHAYSPMGFDRDIYRFYDSVNQWWRNSNESVAMVAVAGGHSDLLSLPDMSKPIGLSRYRKHSESSKKGNIIFSQSYEIPGVGLGIDHLAIVWCAELRKVIVEAIADVVDHSSPYRTVDFPIKIKSLERSFKAWHTSVAKRAFTAKTYHMKYWNFLGLFSHDLEINQPITLVLPAQSSLISYYLKLNKTIEVSQFSANEFRTYGRVREVSLMWYDAGPYVPFEMSNTFDNRLKVFIDAAEPLKVVVSIDWKKTMVNVLLHYRILVLAWSSALVIMSFSVFLSCNNLSSASFTQLFLNVIVGKWFGLLSLGLSALHLILSIPWIQNLVRSYIVFGESANVSSLNSIGLNIYDLLMGIHDPWLFWIAPMLLTVSICFVSLCILISCFVVKIHRFLSKYLTRKFKVKGSSGCGVNGLALSIVLSLPLYFIPYQIATVLIVLFQLMRLTETKGLGFALSQVLLWVAIVDSPAALAFLRGINVHNFGAFSAFQNLTSCLPLIVWVLWLPTAQERSSRVIRWLTQFFLIFIALYTVLYGGFHPFMIHYLTNYFACWLIVAKLLKCFSNS